MEDKLIFYLWFDFDEKYLLNFFLHLPTCITFPYSISLRMWIIYVEVMRYVGKHCKNENSLIEVQKLTDKNIY